MTFLPHSRPFDSAATAASTVAQHRSLYALIKCLRWHQWAKNGLVFVPVVLGSHGFNTRVGVAVAAAFIALCFMASGTYVINDIVDLKHDRLHWSKKYRPLASGAISLPTAWALASALLLASICVCLYFTPPATTIGLAIYFGTSLSYSLWFKRFPLIDVLVLAVLFTLRLGIGVAAAGVLLSPWLLTFSMFLFLSLSLAKRCTEVVRAAQRNTGQATGRGYREADQPLLLALGIAALVASILVFVLYLTQEAFLATRLTSPVLLWGFPPIVFLLGARIWLLSGRGELDDDPVAFAVKDHASLSLMGLTIVLVSVAWIGLPF